MPHYSQSHGVPDRRSWGSLRPSAYSVSIYSYDGDVSPKTSRKSRNPQSQAPVSPMRNSHSQTRRRDSPVSAIQSIDFARTEDARKGSDATVWPSQATSIKKPLLVEKPSKGSQEPWNIVDFYRNARGIYKTGPKGEGQKLWKSYRVAEQVKKQRVEIKKNAPAERRPSAGLAAHPPSRTTSVEMKPTSSNGRSRVAGSSVPWITNRPKAAASEKGNGGVASTDVRKASDVSRSSMDIPVVHLPSTTASRRKSKGKGKAATETRKPSDISRTSLEVPFRIDPDIQQFVDVTKALPKVPLLQPAPARRPQIVSKALPSVPHPQVPPKDKLRPDPYTKPAKSSTKNAFTSTTASSSAYVPPLQGWIASRFSGEISSKTIEPTTSSHQWWKKPALIPTPHMPTKHTRDHSAETKAKISRPRQISDFSTTANIPAAMGGIGGPSTLRAPLRPQAAKKKAYFTEELLGKGRQDSDATFMCAGVREDVPSPLFSGRRSREGSRDTKFYQPYAEVLHEYDDGRH